jgi:hypothetical protein
VSAAKAGVFIWNSSEDASQFHNLYFHHNVIYNDSLSAISYDPKSKHSAFYFSNNIFVGRSNLVQNAVEGIDRSFFICNNWWSINDTFNVDGQKDFKQWGNMLNSAMRGGSLSGSNLDPAFQQPGKTNLTDPFALKIFTAYLTRLNKDGLGAIISPN